MGPDVRPELDRLMEKIEVLPSGCWEWTVGKSKSGYGRFHRGSRSDGTNRTALAHRVAYELLVGRIPKGKTLDHVCHNEDPDCNLGKDCPHRACVNPAHLVPKPIKANILAGRGPGAKNARATHCKHGHPLKGKNLIIEPSGRRHCRECKRERNYARNQTEERKRYNRELRRSGKGKEYAASYREAHREENRVYQREHHAAQRRAEGEPPRRKGPSPEALERRRIADRERKRRKRAAALA